MSESPTRKEGDPSLKRCPKCDEVKPKDTGFYKDKTQASGCSSYCRPCSLARRRAHAERNKDNETARRRRWAEANPEKDRAIKTRYYEKAKKENRLYDKEVRRSISAAYRAVRRTAKVDWDEELTKLVTLEAVNLCRLRKEVTGFDWHIDHIVPLQGKTVCGLHVWNNLQVIPASVNIAKGNSFEG